MAFPVPDALIRRRDMFKSALFAATFTLLIAGCTTTPETATEQVPSFTERVPSGIHNCLTTGTHIQSRERGCAYAAGRSYSKEEVDSTGATNAAAALRALDPTITSR
jgi:hypothetical protein